MELTIPEEEEEEEEGGDWCHHDEKSLLWHWRHQKQSMLLWVCIFFCVCVHHINLFTGGRKDDDKKKLYPIFFPIRLLCTLRCCFECKKNFFKNIESSCVEKLLTLGYFPCCRDCSSYSIFGAQKEEEEEELMAAEDLVTLKSAPLAFPARSRRRLELGSAAISSSFSPNFDKKKKNLGI